MKLRKGAWKLLVLAIALIVTLLAILQVFGAYGYFIIAALGFVSLIWLFVHEPYNIRK